ncbi:methyltransferase [Mesorhizobium sp. L-8-10]|uniref:class I SAM-dependent methyltransferase n=1 Tax=Mesorhizobium sp. L-8-10 TaxID=2744523 RepID=UPI0019253EEF|nr:class I SAM-dependent methyltransferase [Mesorhizobium sp. L-8-10]BCH35662.1 methyltransferase [Mesorhizobium sp. L-8-10]
MNLYRELILPHLVHGSMRNPQLLPYRRRVLAAARGRVVEVGIGSGLNLPLYPGGVTEVIGLDPATRLAAMARRAARNVAFPVTVMEESAEEIPLETGSVDMVVSTWTLCSIPRVSKALSEMRRVLKSGGQLLFVEHGLSPDDSVRRWQNRLTPVWKCCAGGCHLNRPIGSLVEEAGFRCTALETGYSKGPSPMVFMYEGRAAS